MLHCDGGLHLPPRRGPRPHHASKRALGWPDHAPHRWLRRLVRLLYLPDRRRLLARLSRPRLPTAVSLRPRLLRKASLSLFFFSPSARETRRQNLTLSLEDPRTTTATHRHQHHISTSLSTTYKVARRPRDRHVGRRTQTTHSLSLLRAANATCRGARIFEHAFITISDTQREKSSPGAARMQLMTYVSLSLLSVS